MRQEFPAKIKLAAFERANGRCEKCTARLYPGKFRYDHRNPDWFGGEPTLENCQVICTNCDGEKTPKDQRDIAKSKRIMRRRAGIRKPTTFRGWRRFDGSVVHADRHRD